MVEGPLDVDLFVLPVDVTPFKAQKFPLAGTAENRQPEQHPELLSFRGFKKSVHLGSIKNLYLCVLLFSLPQIMVCPSRPFSFSHRIVIRVPVSDAITQDLVECYEYTPHRVEILM